MQIRSTWRAKRPDRRAGAESIETVLAGRIAAGRALLTTFCVTQREAEDRGSPGGQAGGVALAARYAPVRRARVGGLGVGSSWSSHPGSAGLPDSLPSWGTQARGREALSSAGVLHRSRLALGCDGRARRGPRVVGHRRLGGPRPSVALALVRTARGRIGWSGGRPGWPVRWPLPVARERCCLVQCSAAGSRLAPDLARCMRHYAMFAGGPSWPPTGLASARK